MILWGSVVFLLTLVALWLRGGAHWPRWVTSPSWCCGFAVCGRPRESTISTYT